MLKNWRFNVSLSDQLSVAKFHHRSTSVYTSYDKIRNNAIVLLHTIIKLLENLPHICRRFKIILGFIPASARMESLVLSPDAVPPKLVLPNTPYLRFNCFVAAGLQSSFKAIVFQLIAEMCEHNQRAGDVSCFHDGYWWTLFTDEDIKKRISFYDMSVIHYVIGEMADTGVLSCKESDDGNEIWYRVDLAVMQALIVRWELGR